MSTIEGSTKPAQIEVEIKNEKTNNEIDLISSEKRIVNNTDISMYIDSTKQNNIFDDSNKTVDNFNNKTSELIYGIPYENKSPRKIGNVRVFLYIKKTPFIVIGPDCKYNLYFILISFIK